MNYRDLVSKLEELANGQVAVNPADQDQAQQQVIGQAPVQQQGIPGQQPELASQAPAPKIVTPPAPAVAPQATTDPKADINAMQMALKALTMQKPAQPTLTQTTAPTSAEKVSSTGMQQVNKPGEPMEEEIISEKSRAQLAKERDEEEARRQNSMAGKDSAKSAWLDAIRKDPKMIHNPSLDTELKKEIWADIKQTDPKTKASILALSQPPGNSGQEEKQAPKVDPNAKVDDKKDPNAKVDDKKDPNAKVDDKKDPNAKVEPNVEPGKEEKKDVKRTWGAGVLGRGMVDPKVGELQDKLNAAGIKGANGEALAKDNNFGPQTQAAVKELQRKLGIKDDGAFGPQTRAALEKNPDILKTATSPVTAAPVTAAPVTAAPEQSEAERMKAIQDRMDQATKDKQDLDDYNFKNKYKDIDSDKLIRQTGNLKKPYYDLKTGDVDYDDRGVKQVYNADTKNWNSAWGGDSKSGSWSDEPGFGMVGPKATSPEGQKYVADRQARILNPDAAATYDRLGLGKKPVATATPVTAPNQIQAKPVDAVVGNSGQEVKVPGQRPEEISLKGRQANEALHNDLNSVVEELLEWSMDDRISSKVPYTYKDAAWDAGLAGAGALATYATGGLAAPVAGASTVARGARVAKAIYNVASNPEARAVANTAVKGLDLAKSAGKVTAANAAVSGSVNAADAALSDDPKTAKEDLDRIKTLSKR